eukprot:249815-Lingulodinium_polyedra.AAC.1
MPIVAGARRTDTSQTAAGNLRATCAAMGGETWPLPGIRRARLHQGQTGCPSQIPQMGWARQTQMGF